MYVIGIADTRGEFEPKYVAKTEKKANEAKEKLKRELFAGSRQWVAVKKVAEF